MNESRHALNVSNFGRVCDLVEIMGQNYQPTDPEITSAELLAYKALLHNNAEEMAFALAEYRKALRSFSRQREVLIRTALDAALAFGQCKASPEVHAKVRTIADRLAHRTRPSADKTSDSSVGPAGCHKNCSMELIEFHSLLSLLNAETTYDPDRRELTVVRLRELERNVLDSNFYLLATAHHLAQLRAVRNRMLYAACNGAVARARLVREYIHKTFGPLSAHYLEINTISLTGQVPA